MPVHLLDANVLIALGWPNHKHRASAHRWFSSIDARGWATCPFDSAISAIIADPKLVTNIRA